MSCSSPGNCAAIGVYEDSSSREGLLLTESAGFWGAGDKANLPAGAASKPGVLLNSLSCSSVGNCSAVGGYADSSNRQQGLLLTETGGSWGKGGTATPPADAATDPVVVIDSVSCASSGSCTAVGWYDDNSTPSHRQQGMLLAETAGTWSPGVMATLPANHQPLASPYLTSVSCVSVGNCNAVGEYNASSGQQGLLLTETAGTWAAGIETSLPAGAAAQPQVILNTVSCTSPGNCSAVGAYTDGLGHVQGLLLSTARVLTVSTLGSGRGSVTSSPGGVNCGASCSAGFANGSFVQLTARPARGSGFTGWSGACSGRAQCRVQMTVERTVSARFVLLPDTKITQSKIDRARHKARFKFKARGNATGFQCALVKRRKHKTSKPHFSRCHSPKTYRSLKSGRYTFLVRAMNAGGPDPTPARKRFTI